MSRGTLPPVLAQWRARAQARWSTLAQRERRLLLGTLAVVAIGLLWLVAVQPAWRTLRDTPAKIDALDLELQHMQRLAAESRELRALPAVSATQAEAALRAATERLGAKARLTLQGDRAVLDVSGVPGEALLAWLGEARSAARARPDEAQLTRGPAGDYSGRFVLSLARAG